jgi:hypothetical protein
LFAKISFDKNTKCHKENQGEKGKSEGCTEMGNNFSPFFILEFRLSYNNFIYLDEI